MWEQSEIYVLTMISSLLYVVYSVWDLIVILKACTKLNLIEDFNEVTFHGLEVLLISMCAVNLSARLSSHTWDILAVFLRRMLPQVNRPWLWIKETLTWIPTRKPPLSQITWMMEMIRFSRRSFVVFFRSLTHNQVIAAIRKLADVNGVLKVQFLRFYFTPVIFRKELSSTLLKPAMMQMMSPKCVSSFLILPDA